MKLRHFDRFQVFFIDANIQYMRIKLHIFKICISQISSVNNIYRRHVDIIGSCEILYINNLYSPVLVVVCLFICAEENDSGIHGDVDCIEAAMKSG